MRKRNHKLTFDRALTAQEYRLRDAAHDRLSGSKPRSYPEPKAPNPIEQAYLSAIEATSVTRACEFLDRGDHRALLRLGRSMRKR